MLNNRDENRDDKFDDHEESEYHFSDEEVSYEADTGEPPKQTGAAPRTELKENILNRLTRSKRMLISLGVFFILVFVIYKMVAPSSTPTTTDFTPPVAQRAPVTKPVAVQQTPVIPVTSNVTTTQPVTSMQTMQPQNLTTTQQVISPTTGPAVQMAQPQVAQPNTNMTMATAAPTQQQVIVPGQQPQLPTQMQQPPQMQQPQQTIPPVQQPMVTPGMPVTSTAPSVTVTTPASMNAQVPGGVNSAIANLAANNDKLIAQLQADYTQKLNTFMLQSKSMQDQVQTLNTRVAAMEGQLNQLMHTLNRPAPVPVHTEPMPPPPQMMMAPPHVPFNVQAIIPGRAWLKADNGETITVAEGDIIKGLGRVTKIDPYDGIVEINTGSRVISLSYGSGG